MMRCDPPAVTSGGGGGGPTPEGRRLILLELRAVRALIDERQDFPERCVGRPRGNLPPAILRWDYCKSGMAGAAGHRPGKPMKTTLALALCAALPAGAQIVNIHQIIAEWPFGYGGVQINPTGTHDGTMAVDAGAHSVAYGGTLGWTTWGLSDSITYQTTITTPGVFPEPPTSTSYTMELRYEWSVPAGAVSWALDPVVLGSSATGTYEVRIPMGTVLETPGLLTYRFLENGVVVSRGTKPFTMDLRPGTATVTTSESGVGMAFNRTQWGMKERGEVLVTYPTADGGQVPLYGWGGNIDTLVPEPGGFATLGGLLLAGWVVARRVRSRRGSEGKPPVFRGA